MSGPAVEALYVAGPAGQGQALLAAACAAGVTIEALGTEALLRELADAAQGRDGPAVVVLDCLPRPLAIARQVQQAWPACRLLVLAPPDAIDGLRDSIRHTPLMRSITLLTGHDIDPARELVALAEAGRRARRVRTTLNRANAQMAPARPIDATQLRRLQKAERYLDTFLDQAPDAVILVDAELRVLYWNDAAIRYAVGYTGSLRGARLQDLPLWNAGVEGALAAVRTGRTRAQAELRLATLPGTVLELVASSVREDDATFAGAMLALRDVSERERSLQVERASSQAAIASAQGQYLELARLFDQAPGFMAVTRGRAHVFELANRAYFDIMGADELIGRPIDDVFPDLTGQPFARLRDQVFITGEPYVGRNMQISLRRGPGGASQTRYLDFVYQPLFDGAGDVTGIFCQGNDATEYKLMQDLLIRHQDDLERQVAERSAELQKAQAALNHAQKLESIGKLTGGIAHDFNNILQVVAANLELLALEQAGNTAATRRAASAAAAVERGARLTAQLLAYARRQPLQPVALNLSRIVRDLHELLHQVLGKGIDIETVIGGGSWTTMADRAQLENVLINLAVNARDAMGGQGMLTIEVANATLDTQYIAAHADVRPGQYVMVAVTDNGCGMAPETLERAVEPFFTTKREGEGTGLGLSMAFGFVKQSGGHLKLYSEPGIGTTVKIYLPRTHRPEHVEPRPASGPVVGGREAILVVEDDEALRQVVVEQLTALGYAVLRAADAQTALTLLQSGVHVDLLFTDVVMPGPLRSTELVRHARALLPSIGVLYTSGYTQNAIVHEGRLDPGVELLSKPYARPDLARRVREVLDQRPATAPASGSDAGPVSGPAALRIVVVEDNQDGREILCQMLELLGHAVTPLASADGALAVLGAADVLLTDVHLPGQSGLELAAQALAARPGLRVIFVSGAELPVLAFPAALLRKPFTMAQLEAALAAPRP
ncbi:response regulator [Pseudoduganella buxea]|uniref:histidine kinase n=2 Tax=Pseudoduganella buxea TaxID=1949069 RepID=A0ABQ1KLR5_9BURK|nr:response regulator [Pseudoduganella buxea]GGC00795.1 hypothetical protein GCM10011572_23510 [Pseudoduganella buxea]